MPLPEDQQSEREQRRQAWFASPPVLPETVEFPDGEEKSLDIRPQCACCRTTLDLRHVPGPGDICERCYINAPICSVDGCAEIAVDEGKCRDHFMGDCADAPGDLDIRRFAGFRASSVGQFREKWGGLACG